ncbi:alginate lyase family protein [Dehalobacterium formicoaceticum]|uniref:Heparinase II/III family protein n=1 Tax=Dehalobacterium formicoaceticum TaxID=51515 RepID=A0ABT1Y2Y2_9FIRM|nr:alginate lyase family protein [Dehalobacterium formicoaceticum]MCR6545232.1 heparinase II/III family protein [Dehalobacterium formicoaceticum]
MGNLWWYINRMKAMSLMEILWRLQQKQIHKKERKTFGNSKTSVTNKVFNKRLERLNIDEGRLGLNLSNHKYSSKKTIALFDVFEYELYKKNWHAGFQTKNEWPLKFSYDLDYKQRVDIGDVRTNWELNRHFQFPLLAKGCFVTKDPVYMNELVDLFDDWTEKNPFLYGVSWTSIMEVAIRTNSWIFCYCFLKQVKDAPTRILEELRVGIINMTEYIANHYSRFSSANNHVIVEAYVIGLSGIIFDYEPWITIGISILDTEILRQNYADGINKELSLHYQAFVMEALGLFIRVMKFNHIEVPITWFDILKKMSRYVSNCIGKFGEVIVFGDNDEGKILDLQGEMINYYHYVLELMSMLLEERYVDLSNVHENISWIFSDNNISEAKNKVLYDNSNCICYQEGGHTILKSRDRSILIGIDHAALGFGPIAAHGHADALSFQMFVNGFPVFGDPGTYNYHFTPEDRDYFRKTINHNTVTINDRDQSEMLGAFLWGKKANTKINNCIFNGSEAIIDLFHDGYAPVIHSRRYQFNSVNILRIEDRIKNILNSVNCILTFILGPGFCAQVINNDKIVISNGAREVTMNFSGTHDYVIEEDTMWYSDKYFKREKVVGIRIKISTNKDCTLITTISVK